MLNRLPSAWNERSNSEVLLGNRALSAGLGLCGGKPIKHGSVVALDGAVGSDLKSLITVTTVYEYAVFSGSL